MSSSANNKTTHYILASMLIGFIVGLLLYTTGNASMAQYIAPLGTIFIKLLKLMIIPIILSSIFMAMANLGTPEELGTIGTRSILFFFTTTAIAVFIGIIVVNAINPGVDLDLSLFTTGLKEDLSAKLTNSANTGLAQTIMNVFMDAISDNPVASMANSNVLQVIFVAILFGITALYNKEAAKPFVEVMRSLETLSMWLTHKLMSIAPIGIFALIVNIVASTGTDSVVVLAKYMSAVIIGLFLHSVALLIIGWYWSKKNPIQILQDLSQSLFTAFSTSSSAATLPVTMACVEDNLGVDRKTAQFVLPLGATINMNGTALYESIAVIFIGQAYNLDLSMGNQIIIFITASIAAIGAAAIPGAGLVTMSIVLTAVGYPLEGIGLILAVDRILDMFRTAVNVFGDCIGTLVVDRSLKKQK